MFNVSVNPSEYQIEGSLGGRVTSGEMRVFRDELWGAVEARDDETHTVVINLAKAQAFEPEALSVIDELRNDCISAGLLVVNVVRDAREAEWYSEYRRHSVQNGDESYKLDETIEELAVRERAEQRRAA